MERKMKESEEAIWPNIPTHREITDDLDLGECRMNPPQIDFETGQSQWPVTASDMGCYQCRLKTKGFGKVCRNCKAWRKFSEEEMEAFREEVAEAMLEDAIEDEIDAADEAVAESMRIEAEERMKAAETAKNLTDTEIPSLRALRGQAGVKQAEKGPEASQEPAQDADEGEEKGEAEKAPENAQEEAPQDAPTE
jgi:hypothetical protein